MLHDRLKQVNILTWNMHNTNLIGLSTYSLIYLANHLTKLMRFYCVVRLNSSTSWIPANPLPFLRVCRSFASLRLRQYDEMLRNWKSNTTLANRIEAAPTRWVRLLPGNLSQNVADSRWALTSSQPLSVSVSLYVCLCGWGTVHNVSAIIRLTLWHLTRSKGVRMDAAASGHCRDMPCSRNETDPLAH